jgi:C4-dicarboxylate-binding protein DctP
MKRGIMKAIWQASIVIAVSLSVASFLWTQPRAHAAEKVIFKMSSFAGPTYPPRIHLENFKEMIEKRSNGRIRVDHYPSESLVKLNKAFDATIDNVVQIGLTSASYEPTRLGILSDVANMPWNWDPYKFAEHFRDPGGFYDFAAPYFEKNGLKLMSWCSLPHGEIFSRKPIRKLEDFKGKMLRTITGLKEPLILLGAEPIFIPTAELFNALQRGVVDGATLAISSYFAEKHYEIAPYLQISNLYTSHLAVIMNLKVLNSLPPDLNKLVLETFLDADKQYNERIKRDTNELIKKLKSLPKVEVYEVPPKEVARWQSALKPYYDAMAKKWGNEWVRFVKIREKLM